MHVCQCVWMMDIIGTKRNGKFSNSEYLDIVV